MPFKNGSNKRQQADEPHIIPEDLTMCSRQNERGLERGEKMRRIEGEGQGEASHSTGLLLFVIFFEDCYFKTIKIWYNIYHTKCLMRGHCVISSSATNLFKDSLSYAKIKQLIYDDV